MNKKFEDFLATLNPDKIREMISVVENENHVVPNTMDSSILISIELLRAYHKWLSAD